MDEQEKERVNEDLKEIGYLIEEPYAQLGQGGYGKVMKGRQQGKKVNIYYSQKIGLCRRSMS